MNKEERAKLFFKTISEIAGFEIKPEKDFYMIGNGTDGVYQISEGLNLYYKKPDSTYTRSDYSIFPIFKGAYEFEEIKEPLLTDEEKEFLRQFKFEEMQITPYSYMYMFNKNTVFAAIYLNSITIGFDKLEVNRKYSREELEL